MEQWTQEDQDKAAALRREAVDHFQESRRSGSVVFTWIFDKLADAALWIEREGKRLKRGF